MVIFKSFQILSLFQYVNSTESFWIMNKCNHRIMALVMGPDVEKPAWRSYPSMSVSPLRKRGARAQSERYRQTKSTVDIQDSKTLLVNWNDDGAVLPENGVMNFDYVGFASRARSKVALLGLLDQLFFDHRSVCLIILKGHPWNWQSLPAEVLVDEINQRIKLCHGALTFIQVQYFDVRENEIINMMEKKKEHTCAQRTFKTTGDLGKWFRNEYAQLWADMRGHECFDIQFGFNDSTKRPHNLKLSLLQIHLYRMVMHDRLIIGQILENIADPIDDVAEKAKSKLLLRCMKDYLSDKWCTCVTFEVPTRPEELYMTKEMIRLAHCGVIGFQKLREKCKTGDKVVQSTKSLKSIKSYQTTIRSRSETAVRHVNRSPSLENFHGRSVAHWTFKIDQQFSAVMRTMQRYYERVNTPRIRLLCLQARKIILGMDDPVNVRSESGVRNLIASCQHDFDAYKHEMADFSQLEHLVIQLTKNKSTLSAYIKARNSEICQQTQRCKAKYIRLLEEKVRNIVREALNQLKK